jgi:predicted flap endonuclease-1-like 5' DNA nuclease
MRDQAQQYFAVSKTSEEQIESIGDSSRVRRAGMPSELSKRPLPFGAPDGLTALPVEKFPAARATGDRAMSLHVSKLRGISYQVRSRLKQQGVTYTHQLLEAAGRADSRRALAAKSGIEEPTLMRLTCRADLARVKGIGAIFADMLELIGVDQVTHLAGQDPASLHAALFDLNAAERFARRAPTQDEVHDWVTQARNLPRLIE